MPKKLRPAVDLMAFKCLTPKFNFIYIKHIACQMPLPVSVIVSIFSQCLHLPSAYS